jgi:hypothetical protein
MYKNIIKDYFTNTSKVISNLTEFEKEIFNFAKLIYKKKK